MDLLGSSLKYALYFVLGLGAIFVVMLVFTLVEKPYRRRKGRGVDESDGRGPREGKHPVEDFPDPGDV